MLAWTLVPALEFMAGSLAQPARSPLALAPLRDLPLDRLGDVAPHELAHMIVDRLDQLGAGSLDDGLQMRREPRLEPGIDEKIEPLQDLHRYLLGKGAPAF